MHLVPQKLTSWLEKRLHLLPIVHNGIWLLSERGARLAFGLLVSAWVARYLGPSQFGELAYVLAFMAIFQGIANLGLDGIVVREIAQKKSAVGIILGTTFALRSLAAILCWIIAVVSVGLTKGFASESFTLTALIGGGLLFQSSDTVDLWFQSQSQSRRTVLAKFSAYVIANAIRVAMILMDAPLIAFALVIGLEAFLNACGLYIAYRLYPCGQFWTSSIKKSKELLLESWPYILSTLSIILYMRIDQIMIKAYLGDDQLGIYAAILPLATLWQFLPMTIMVSLGPLVASKKLEGDRAYLKLLYQIFRLYALLGWASCALVFIFSGYLIPLLYGEQYLKGVGVIKIYVLTNIFINMGVAQSLWLINERKPIISMYKTLSGAISCVIGNILLLPMYGIQGAAWVAVISMGVSAVFSNLIFDKKIFFMQMRSLILILNKNV